MNVSNPIRCCHPVHLGRARTRSLALQIACEIHPLNNLRVLKFLKGQYGETVDAVDWMSHWMNEGFAAIEHNLRR